jgi:hypothetical protein
MKISQIKGLQSYDKIPADSEWTLGKYYKVGSLGMVFIEEMLIVKR